MSSSPVSNGRGTVHTPISGSTTYDNYDSQVNFLNSIIVELHSKNTELEQRLRDAIANPSGLAMAAEKQRFAFCSFNYASESPSFILF